EAPGDEVVRLCGVRVKANDGRVSETVDISQPLQIEIEYELLQPGHELRIYFHVFNEEGIEAFMSIDNDSSWIKKPRPSGRYVSTSVIPGNLLSEGRYFIGPSIGTENPTVRRLRVNDAVAFHVIDSMDG
ncbi:MAG: Wzt carbohydrate-binding domain-containing protein, partial [Nitrospira sp.]|nr:Wzt carbohydrate-binding domain-containing protein [Nitrospira sp.]